MLRKIRFYQVETVYDDALYEIIMPAIFLTIKNKKIIKCKPVDKTEICGRLLLSSQDLMAGYFVVLKNYKIVRINEWPTYLLQALVAHPEYARGVTEIKDLEILLKL